MSEQTGTGLRERVARIIREDASFDDLSEAHSIAVAEKVVAEMEAALKRAIRAEAALARIKDPDPLVLNAATEASLRGVNLAPVPIEHAIEDPRNREAIRRALSAAVDQVTE